MQSCGKFTWYGQSCDLNVDIHPLQDLAKVMNSEFGNDDHDHNRERGSLCHISSGGSVEGTMG